MESKKKDETREMFFGFADFDMFSGFGALDWEAGAVFGVGEDETGGTEVERKDASAGALAGTRRGSIVI
jgi:hypothetical protein